MSAETLTELQKFHDFVFRQLKNGQTQLAPEQVLHLWREQSETFLSIQRGLEDVDAGRTIPANEVLENLGRDVKYRSQE